MGERPRTLEREALALISRAKQGDVLAIREIFDAIYGNPTDSSEDGERTKSIRARCAVSEFPSYNEDSAQYVRNRWRLRLPPDGEVDFIIEVRDYPSIMKEVESLAQRPLNRTWLINRISEDGVTLYEANGRIEHKTDVQWAELHVFIPVSNIVSVYVGAERFLTNQRPLSSESVTGV